VPVEDSSSANTFSSQSSYHSTNSLYGAEANKVLTLVESFSLLSFYPYQKSIIDAKGQNCCLAIYWKWEKSVLSIPTCVPKQKSNRYHVHNHPHAGSNNASK